MEPDLYNLSGLQQPGSDEKPEEQKKLSMSEVLDQLYQDIKTLINTEDTASSGAEVAWFCGEKVRKVLGFVLSTPKAKQALG